jgi:hypothetical protein
MILSCIIHQKKKTDTVYHRLVEAANSHHRSLTKEIVFALASYVQQSSQDKTVVLEQIRAVRSRYSPTITEADIAGWKESGRP